MYSVRKKKKEKEEGKGRSRKKKKEKSGIFTNVENYQKCFVML